MPHSTSYYSGQELRGLGLASCGHDVLVSRKASIYSPNHLHIGDHVRIDDFVVIACGPDEDVVLGDHVHIAAHAALFGGGGIVLEDFVGVSGRASIYSVTDDYGGDVLTNPTVPDHLKSIIRRHVLLRRHVLVGASSVVLPGVTIDEGSATGAMTLVNRDLEPWGIYVGIPARLLRPRSRGLLKREAELRDLESQGE
jgi:acetyltransferase-like isoleucine patch superfamily enzyme